MASHCHIKLILRLKIESKNKINFETYEIKYQNQIKMKSNSNYGLSLSS